MAKLSNINGKFAVEDTGAIRFSDQTGTTGQILKSNGNSAPTWVDPNTVGTGPWLPLAGGVVSGPTTFQSSLTVGGLLTGANATFNGLMKLDAGGILQFAANTTTPSMGVAIHRSAADTLNFVTASTNRLTIDDDGNVGIGIDTPTLVAGKIVHIHGVAAGVHLTDTASGTTSGDGGYVAFDNPNLYIQNKEAGSMFFETSGTTALTIDSDQDATFAGVIGVNGSTNANIPITATTSSGYEDVAYFKSAGTNINSRISLFPTGTGDGVVNSTANDLILQTGGADRVTITDTNSTFAGNIYSGLNGMMEFRSSAYNNRQIGIDSQGFYVFNPNAPSGGRYDLKINDSGNATFAGNVGIGVAADTSVRTFIKGSDSGTNNFQILTRNSSDANILAVRNDGNVGINASDPVKTLDVRGSLAISNSTASYWYMDRNDTTGNFDLNENTNGTLFTVTPNGHVLLGNTTVSLTSGTGFKFIKDTFAPYIGLVVNSSAATGNTNYHYYNTNTSYNGFRFYIANNGGIYNFAANNVNLSDERVKHNIENSGNYLDKICSIPVRLFNYKDEPEGTNKNLGVIAQEVEAIAPELVNNDGFGETPEDGIELKTVYSNDMMYALMKAVQELKADNDILKARIKILENK